MFWYQVPETPAYDNGKKVAYYIRFVPHLIRTSCPAAVAVISFALVSAWLGERHTARPAMKSTVPSGPSRGGGDAGSCSLAVKRRRASLDLSSDDNIEAAYE